MDRDKRWARVYASITRPEITGEDLESGWAERLKHWWVLRIEVPYGKIVYYSTNQFNDEDMNEPWWPEAFKMVMDRMVARIDEEMKKNEAV